MQTAIPIIKIVGNSCNLRCRYCYYNGTDQSIGSRMSLDLLEEFLVQYMEIFNGRLSFIWFGGEPLLAGLSFFSKIVEIQARLVKKDQEIVNFVQTNAILINPQWARFFKKHKFRVGVSLDGDEESHNRFRRMHHKEGSFMHTMRGIEILRKHNIEPGIIQTMTVDNLKRNKKNFYFFTKVIGIKKWGTNIYKDIFAENQTMMGQSLTNHQLASFFMEQIDLWLEQADPSLEIREIEDRICGIFSKIPKTCTLNGSCANYFCIEPNGEVYPCDKSSGRSDLLLGDISKQTLLKILDGDVRRRYAKKVATLPIECQSCEWQQVCNNGCTMQRVGSIEGKYNFCDAQKTAFTYLKSRLAELGY